MAIPTVARARVSPPRSPIGAIERTRLFEMLDAGASGPLTVVTGTPGAGKTMLVSTWLAQRAAALPTAWLSLEAIDDAPVRFWRAVTDALENVGTPQLEALAEYLRLDHAEFLPALANAITALPGPFVLMLDDFHEVRTPEVSEQLDALLKHSPDKLRLVIISRSDPQLSLHRLRLEGRVAEVRTADLAFTVEEAAELFASAELELTDAQVAALHARTEGWAAGLRLAALSLHGRDDVEELVDQFAGDEGAVAGYLVEEVLHLQPEEIREFMLRTSIVELICPELADALTGRDDGSRILERLEHSNAFIAPVADQHVWYRYHMMFRELLRSQLRHRMPDLYGLQHARAARWYARRGLNVAATRHALAAEDWELAGNLLSSEWLSLIVNGESALVAELVAALPRQQVARQPELGLAAAGALIESGELEQGQEYLRLAEDRASAVRPSRRVNLALGRTIAQLYEARGTGDPERIAAAAHKLLAGHGSEAMMLDRRERRALALMNLGIAETWRGNARGARAALEESLALARNSESSYLVLCALSPLSLLEALTGSLRRAAALAQEAVALADRHGWVGRPASAAAHCALAICAYHWNSTSEASRHLGRAELPAHASLERPMRVVVQMIRALVALQSGDHDSADTAIRTARQDADGWTMPQSLAIALAAVEATGLLAAGRTEDAVDVLETAEPIGRWAELELVRARLALADGDPRGTAELIENALRGTRRLHPSTAIELQALASVAARQSGDDELALELVEQALAMAEPEGYLSPFLSIGAPLRELVVRRIRAGTSHRALAGELGEVLDPHSTAFAEQRGALVLEPLSERETAVLRFLPTGLSKAEIAAEMFVSVNTVKTHMKNIYRKLDVTDRAQAVRRARTLHLC